MKNFLTFYNLLIESSNINELLPTTTFESLKRLDKIKVYRASARKNKTTYNPGDHAGTEQQALIRADYMVNDEERYDQYYLYELEIKLSRIYPVLESENGQDHGNDHYKHLVKDYDLVIYKNMGEGNIKNPNLSIIILNPRIIISSKFVKTLTSDYLTSIQDELYL